LSHISNTWLWAWANMNVPPKIRGLSKRARLVGTQHGYPRLVEAKWLATEEDAWQMTAILVYRRSPRVHIAAQAKRPIPTSCSAGCATWPANKRMKLTKPSAAPWLAWRCRLMPAAAGLEAGTASQLIPGVRRTWAAERHDRPPRLA